MNVWTGTGRLVHEPELKMTKNGSEICRVRIAVNDGYGDKKTTTFITIVTFGKVAQNVSNYCHKGKEVCVTGRLSVETFDKQDGSKGTSVEIIASQVDFMSSGGGNSAPKKEADVTPPPGFTELEEQEALPF